MFSIVQGDCPLSVVTDLDEVNAVLREGEHQVGETLVKRGEGPHCHRLAVANDDCKVVLRGATLYLVVDNASQGTPLVHEEHGTQTVVPQKDASPHDKYTVYRLTPVTEYDPLADEIRNQTD